MSFDAPAPVIARLEEIDGKLAEMQNLYEQAAFKWFQVRRTKEKQHAEEYLKASGTVNERAAHADLKTAVVGVKEEATYEMLKAGVKVLEARASIGQSILRAQGRV